MDIANVNRASGLAGVATPSPAIRHENTVDVTQVLDITCKSCSKQIPVNLAVAHVEWHGRTNFLYNVGRRLRGDHLKYGARVWGRLWRIQCPSDLDQTGPRFPEEISNAVELFCTVPYAEGSKFTFGNAFDSRRRQGEYVFLSLSESGSNQDVFRLQCEKDELMISSLVDKTFAQLYVNGVSLVDTNLRICFGDIISIYTGPGQCQRYMDFVFGPAFQRSNQKSIINDNIVTHMTLKNPLIVGEILKYTNVEDVKELRYLSSLWNEEGIKYLKTNASAHFLDKVEKSEADHLSNICIFQASSMFLCASWVIDLTKFKGNDAEIMGKKLKLQEDIGQLISLEPNHVTRLKLTLKLYPGNVRVCQSLLKAVGPSLKSFHFAIHNGSESSFKDGFTLPQFHNLEEMVLDMEKWSGNLNSNIITPLLIRHSRILKRLSFVREDVTCCNFPEIFFSEMLVAKQKDDTSFSNLMELETGMWHSRIALPILNSIELRSLTKIKLVQLSGNDVAGINLSHVLEQCKENLTSLEIWYSVRNELQINFPGRLEKLSSLAIFVVFTSSEQINRVKLSFGNTDELFSRMQYFRLPSLEEFTMWPATNTDIIRNSGLTTSTTPVDLDWNRFRPVIAAFIEQGASVAENVKKVQLPFLLQERYCRALDRLETVFPVTQFPSALASARNAPVAAVNDDDDDDGYLLVS